MASRERRMQHCLCYARFGSCPKELRADARGLVARSDRKLRQGRAHVRMASRPQRTKAPDHVHILQSLSELNATGPNRRHKLASIGRVNSHHTRTESRPKVGHCHSVEFVPRYFGDELHHSIARAGLLHYVYAKRDSGTAKRCSMAES